METKNDVLYYLNQLHFTDHVIDTDFENLRYVRRFLINEFADFDIPKLIDVSNFNDILFITLTVGGLQVILIKTNTLGENILYLTSFKNFVESNCESD